MYQTAPHHVWFFLYVLAPTDHTVTELDTQEEMETREAATRGRCESRRTRKGQDSLLEV